MTQTKSTLDRVRALIEANTDGEPFTDDQPLFYDASAQSSDAARAAGGVGLDSLDRVEVVMMVEDEFGIDVPDCDVADDGHGTTTPLWNTAAGIARYVDARLEQERG